MLFAASLSLLLFKKTFPLMYEEVQQIKCELPRAWGKLVVSKLIFKRGGGIGQIHSVLFLYKISYLNEKSFSSYLTHKVL